MNGNQQSLNNVQGKPFVYNEVKIYPIKMKNALDFYQCVNCLTIDKNTIPDIKVIKMSYLEFIIALSQQENYKILYDNLINLLSLVLQQQKFFITPDNENKKFIIRILKDSEDIELYNFLLKEYEFLFKKVQDNNIKQHEIMTLYEVKNELDNLFLNNTSVLTGKDFDNIRKIILRQNLIKFDDELINAEVKQILQESQEFIQKKKGNKQATLEELMISYCCDICNGKPKDYEDIQELTIYQFYKGLERKSLSKQQMMLSTAMGMGGISPKDVPNWLDHTQETGLYDEAILKDDEVNKLGSIGKKQ